MNRVFAETMGESFTEDIFIDIFLRLPAKSLMRFKCVAKQWRPLISKLISDPSFVKSHLQRLKAGDLIHSQRIVVGTGYGPLETVDYEALDRGCEDRVVVVPHSINPLWNPSVVGSCDGLVCLLVPGIYLIYNPTTREYREVPGSDFVGEIESFRGFGYDSQSDDYKIVEGVVGYDIWEVAIFSLKSSSWRTIQVQFQEETHCKVRNPGVYWNGAIHWCPREWFVDYRVSHNRLRERGVIMSFDLSEERFHRELPVPEVDVDMTLEGLGIHGASLFIYCSTLDPRIEAWITDEHGRGGGPWTKWFSLDSILLDNNRSWKVPLTYTRSGKVVLLMDRDQMILVNPLDNSRKDYPVTRGDGLIEHAMYLETLVSPYLGVSSE